MSLQASPASVVASPLAPGPRGWPVVGNLPSIRSEGFLGYLGRLWREHGDVFRFAMGNRQAVAVVHPDAVKHVLATRVDNYIKGETYNGVRRVIGNGVLALEGEAWRSRRALVQPAFHRQALPKLAAAMVRSGDAFFGGLQREHPSGWFEVDAHHEMVKLTLDVVVRALFGEDLVATANVPADALGASLELVSQRANGVVLPRWIPTPANRRFHDTMGEVEAAIFRVIEAGRQRDGSDGTLLSMLLSSRDADTGEPLSDRDVRDEIFTMFVAGHETTALTLTWLFVLLDGQPEVLAKMRAEVDTTLNGRDPTFDHVPKLTYLRQVIDETLRLAGPVAMTARNTVNDDVIAGFRVEAGTVVMPFFWATHRHPDFWSNPMAFDPDHFAPEAIKGRNLWSYVPFSAGQRKCIGDTFSLVETTLLLAMFLNRFDVEVPKQIDVKPVAMVTVRPSKPVQLRLRARR